MPHQRPPVDTFNHVGGWRCPLCNGTGYSRVTVAKANGTTYRTEFYQCDGCTVIFRHPGRFTRLGVPIRRWAGDVGPKTLAEAHHYWRDALEKKG